MSDENQQLLVQFAEVKGQLSAVLQLMQHNHDSTHQRINDFRTAVEGRIAGVEARLEKVEDNERGTALRVAGGGALAAAIVAGGIEAIKFAAGR